VSRLRRALSIAVFLCAFGPSPAFAQAGWMVTPFLGMKFGGSTTIVDLELAASSRKTTYGVAGSFLTKGWFGVEAEFAYIPGYLENRTGTRSPTRIGGAPLVKSSSVIDLAGNIVFALPPSVTRGGLRPYAVAGAGVSHAEAVDVLDIFRIRRSVPVLSFGAGAIGLVSNNVGVRFDVRHLNSLARDDESLVAIVGKRISYWRLTVGLVRRF
jgi:hypothetical protein